jgi:hypothetical protein
VFTLTLSKPVDTAITIDYHTIAVSATATGNLDYIDVDPPVTVSIPAMATTATITIYVRQDAIDESNETFKVILSNLVAPGRWVTVSDDEGVGTIWDDD